MCIEPAEKANRGLSSRCCGIHHYTGRRDPLNIPIDSEILVFKGAASLGESVKHEYFNKGRITTVKDLRADDSSVSPS